MQRARQPAFLIFSGYNLRAIVALCRALSRRGRPFAIIACTPEDPIFRTSWRRQVAATRASREMAWEIIADCIARASMSVQPSRWVIAPSSEYLVRWCLAHRAQLDGIGCHLPLPERGIYERLSDKRPLVDFARGAGLPVPAEAAAPGALGFPCVAKPCVNVTPDGRSLRPWLLRNAADASAFAAATRPAEYFFQEWVEGESIYLLLHLGTTAPTVAFSQRNLAQQPAGRSIVLAEAATFHEQSTAAAWIHALRDSGFAGVAMIEFRVRPEAPPVLIELNPRLWGPLQLVVDRCPELLDAYFDETLGPAAAGSQPLRRRHQGYAWLGGAAEVWRRSEALEWHGPRPRCPRLRMWRHLPDEVFFRCDTWRLLLHELTGNETSLA